MHRYVCQLQRVTIKFCKNSQSSRGVREYVESKLLDYSRQNPGVAIYMKPRLHKSPVIVAEYLNGQSQWMSIHNFSATELQWWLEFIRTRLVYFAIELTTLPKAYPVARSGYELTQLISKSNVLTPSVQGIWSPFLNRPTNSIGKTFPDSERSAFIPEVPSATQKLLDLVEKYKLSAVDESEISQEENE